MTLSNAGQGSTLFITIGCAVMNVEGMLIIASFDERIRDITLGCNLVMLTSEFAGSDVYYLCPKP